VNKFWLALGGFALGALYFLFEFFRYLEVLLSKRVITFGGRRSQTGVPDLGDVALQGSMALFLLGLIVFLLHRQKKNPPSSGSSQGGRR
jgi:hypothetical protein